MSAMIAPVASAGDRGDTLRALRDRVAAQLDDTNSARDVAALSKRLMELLAEIEALPDDQKRSPADEIAARRDRRRAAAKSQAGS